MTYDVEFYQKENGDVPVRDFLVSLSPKMRAKAFSEIELLKHFAAWILEKDQQNPGARN